MKIIGSVKELRQAIKAEKLQAKSVGFVPTMGFLHEGHLSLVRAAKENNDIVVVSIFVNPTQFGENEDLDAYPRDLEGDQAKLVGEGVDILFYPTVEEMYPQGYSTYVDVEGDMTGVLCGSSRPGHFRGVATVVTKLFNMVAPDRAYFGQKDAQQVSVIERMVKDLNMDLEIVPCPIHREADGLAMSSRNTYLSEKERKDALVLSASLFEAKDKILAGETSAEKIISGIVDKISTVDYAIIDYVEIVDALSLERIDTLKGTILIALAVKVGKPRLIDNLRLEV
ncbi:pantoate--beta-alanine ligase [Acidaminobacter sp. JC074]|uniref:pantoate--beta-alanine ligase n=1 Tax=Acidaminobacter sp. JC074 TaxID=2530199 RepID=UPI001F0EF554|nr:pantoate--beta-alanine ligase [Acidaminobacter sp. JC074]MCH4889010.1 pantoate--beta-alanine ligase [Acidaminobacter sp. JC074]